MPPDYAKKKKSSRRAQPAVAPWLWWLTGLLMGAFFMALILLKWHPALSPTTEPTSQHSASKPKQADHLAKKPKFDFYTLLPEMEIAIPEPPDKKSASQSQPKVTKQIDDPSAQFILQLASFRDSKDAEQQKALFALQGFEVTVETVKLHGETWHRLRQGPFAHLNEVEKRQAELQQHHISSLLLKLKPRSKQSAVTTGTG